MVTETSEEGVRSVVKREDDGKANNESLVGVVRLEDWEQEARLRCRL